MGKRRYVDRSSSITFLGVEKFSSEISSLIHRIQNPHLHGSRFKILHLYWKIGRLIAEYEQQQAIKEEEHSEFLLQLIGRLSKKRDNQFVRSVLEESYRFYLLYPSAFKTPEEQDERLDNSQLQTPLSWEHYRFLIYINCPQARNFYEKEAFNSNWTPSLLQHFIKNRLFERLCASVNKESVLRSAQLGNVGVFSENNNYLEKIPGSIKNHEEAL
ncbi:MAG: hypothetical protein JNJ47_04680 [Alphaproteobacteria bacterium]|nr:hypothetical protein [Alphaproteobacteria bacterium]